MAQVSAELRKALNALTTAGQDVLLELHARYQFDDDQLECFILNSGRITINNLGLFETFLQTELEEAAAKLLAENPSGASKKQVRRRPKKNSGSKRKSAATTSVVNLMETGNGNHMTELPTPLSKRTRGNLRDIPDVVIDLRVPEVSDSQASIVETPSRRLQIATKTALKAAVCRPITTRGTQRPTRIRRLGDDKLWTGRRHLAYEWMDESLEERNANIDAHFMKIKNELTAAMELDVSTGDVADVKIGTIGVPTQSEVLLCGRIACEGLEGKLNEHSILLEDSCSSGNISCRLDVTECPNIVAFPGQVVGVLGRTDMSGHIFYARDLLTGLPVRHRQEPRGLEPLHLIVACGPFSVREKLDYSPFETLMEYVVEKKPDALILCGPFLENSNHRVSACDIALPGDTEPCTFEDVYSRHILPMLVRCLAPLRQDTNASTEVLILPSLEETLIFHPMPQPPLDAALDIDPGAIDTLRRLGVHLLPNPATLEINGLLVTVTSADALSPVVRELFVRPDNSKVEESLRQLLRQRTLFPVLPREPAQVSEARAGAFDFAVDDRAPDLCIFPSLVGGLTAAVVDGTIFCNPGRLCRPAALGSFAELWVLSNDNNTEIMPLSERVHVDVHKLV